MKILIIGDGFIGNRCANSWEDEAVISDKRINSTEDIVSEIEKHKPDTVLNAAGRTGRPNVDWCEDNQLETIVGNTKLPIILAEGCYETDTYLLHVGSGCIFYGESHHEDGKWREDDHGNPEPVYSRTKWAADLTLSTLENVGIARIRMPIDHVPSPRNLIDKLINYEKVIDVENSVTIVEDMIDVFYQLLEQKGEEIYHVTNPGTLKHRDIISHYKEYVDPDHDNEWITEEELVELGLADKERSNNFLHSSNLEDLGIEMRHIQDAIEDTMKKYAELKKINND